MPPSLVYDECINIETSPKPLLLPALAQDDLRRYDDVPISAQFSQNTIMFSFHHQLGGENVNELLKNAKV